jgi:hypothetical protein
MKAGTADPEKTSVTRYRHDKHVFTVKIINAAIQGIDGGSIIYSVCAEAI